MRRIATAKKRRPKLGREAWRGLRVNPKLQAGQCSGDSVTVAHPNE